MEHHPMPGPLKFDLMNRRWLIALGLCCLAFALTYLSVHYGRDAGRIESIWPLNAVMLVVLMRWPRRFWAMPLMALAVGNLGANLYLGDDGARAALLATANTIEAGVAAYLLVGKYPVRLSRRSGFGRFVFAVLVACCLSTVVALSALLISGGTAPVEGAVLWLASHGLGLLVFTPPLVIAFSGQIVPLIQRETILRTLILVGIVAIISVASFAQSAFPVLFIAPVIVVLVAYQLGVVGAALAILLIALVAIPLTLSGFGPVMLVKGSTTTHVVYLQVFLAMMSLTGMLVGGSVVERRASVRRLLNARSRAQRQSVRERELLDQARLSETISNVGHWTLSPTTGDVFWSPEVYRIHGVDPCAFDPKLDDALSFYVPEDRSMISALIEDRIESGDGWSFDASLVRRSDGQLRHVHSVATCMRNASGAVVKIFGVFKDLTDERRMLAELEENETRYRLLAENATDVVAVYDVDGVFSYLSPSIHDMLGYYPEELIGCRTYSIMSPGEARRVADAFARAVPDLDNFHVEYQAVRKDGGERWLEARPRPQLDDRGRIIGFIDNVRDVTERRERETALAEASAAADAATLSKAAFLANMSHEIRTPLNGVLGFASLLSRTELDAEQVRFVDRIQSASTGLALLINDILDVSRIEAGKMEIETRAFQLRPLAEEVVDLVAASTTEKPIDFSVEVSSDLNDWMVGDDARIRQILLNLVGNAAKFTTAGTVTVAIDQDGSSLEIRVIDSGPGVSADQLATLFNSFTQADSSITRRFGGTGLGLTISRSLARLMDGELTMESEVGVGTTVILTLPYQPSAHADGASEVTPLSKASPGRRATPLTIMVVDDVEMNREFVQIALGREGHTVTAVASAQQALDALGDGQGFDLILMDVQMPGMDGLAATRIIRGLAGPTNLTPIIGLTADVLPEQVAACRDAGMDDHIAKPVDLNQLVERVSRIAARPESDLPLQARTDSSDRNDALSALSLRYADHLKTIPDEVDRLCRLPLAERADCLARLAHSVAGTAGSLGFPSVSSAAFDLEDRAKRTTAADIDPEGLDTAVQKFRDALSAAA